jgi:hypothetical protein
MKTILNIIAGVVAMAISTNTFAAQYESYQLPVDPAEPVITMDFQGDRLTRIDAAPTLSILADGTVIMPQSYAHTKAYKSKITLEELQELLNFVISENHFFDYNKQAVKAELRKLKTKSMPVHVSTTIITVNANEQSKTVRHASLSQGHLIPQTEQLLQVKLRLEQLMSIVKIGGKKELSKWLKAANDELKWKSPKEAPFQESDLQGAEIRADGSIYVRFARSNKDTITSVTTDIAADGKRLISVSSPKSK